MSGRPPYYFTAYGLAVKHGFQGTEQEWLESLNGDNVVLRYQDGTLQWKLARAGEDSWAPLFDLGQIQRWAEAAEVFRNEAAQHSEDAGVSANEATAIAEELAQRSEALARSITTSMVLDYNLGSLYTHTGAEADGADYANRIRSGFFPVLSGKLNVYAPTSVKSRLVFYNADLSFRSSVNEFASGSYSASTTAVFARLIVGYDSDAEVADVATLAAMVAVCMPVEVPEGGATFHITVTGNDADGYVADKTYEEIREAWKQGQSCVCNCAGLLMPLVMLGGDAQFDTVWNGQEYRVYISPAGNVRVDISELGGGGSGGSGVYVGTEEPTDPNVYVWINPEGDADEPESGSEYALPVATSETLGGVMPVAKTEAMTQSVGVDALGRLWAVAGGGSGEGGGNVSFYEAELTMEQDVKKIRVELPSVAKNFFVWSLVSVLPDTGTEGERMLYVNIGGANINCSTSAQTVGSFVISAAKNGDCVSIGGRNRPDEQYNHAGSAFVSSGNNAFGGSTSLSSAKGAYIDLAAANDVMFPTGTWIKFWGMYSE